MNGKNGLISLLVVVLITSAVAQDAGKQVTAFVNVNVIPMDRERVLKDQTVVVRDGRIAEIGAANRIKVPAGALAVRWDNLKNCPTSSQCLTPKNLVISVLILF